MFVVFVMGGMVIVDGLIGLIYLKDYLSKFLILFFMFEY